MGAGQAMPGLTDRIQAALGDTPTFEDMMTAAAEFEKAFNATA